MIVLSGLFWLSDFIIQSFKIDDNPSRDVCQMFRFLLILNDFQIGNHPNNHEFQCSLRSVMSGMNTIKTSQGRTKRHR